MKLADDREKDGGTSGTAVEGALDDGGRSPPPPSPAGGGTGAAATPNDIFIAPTKEHTEQALHDLRYLFSYRNPKTKARSENTSDGLAEEHGLRSKNLSCKEA